VQKISKLPEHRDWNPEYAKSEETGKISFTNSAGRALQFCLLVL
jgi:hypothetical protein